MLKVAYPSSTSNTISAYYTTNTIEVESDLLQILAKTTDIPHMEPLKLDTTLRIIPYPYLLLAGKPGIPLALARQSGKLSSRQSLLLDLRIGSYFKQLHESVQNDWFGLPSQGNDELYSWQEAFTSLLEGLLHEGETIGVNIPYEDVRRYLSRAIGSFLFDDCEVPSLVSLTGDEWTVMVDFDPETPTEDEQVPITSMIPTSYALWGDPMLEAMFLEPSVAFLEGYGGSPVVFARQKTKRLWYNLFLALIVVLQAESSKANRSDTIDSKTSWARDTLVTCIEKLKDAPCY